MGILKWLAHKNTSINKKSFEMSFKASFYAHFSEISRLYPELKEEERIGAALYEILSDRYPQWSKEEIRSVIGKYNSCAMLSDFLFEYGQGHGKANDVVGFQGSSRYKVTYGPPEQREIEDFKSYEKALSFAREKAKDIKGARKVILLDVIKNKGFLIRPGGRVDEL